MQKTEKWIEFILFNMDNKFRLIELPWQIYSLSEEELWM